MLKVLVADLDRKNSKILRLLDSYSDKEYRFYLLNNAASLADDSFLSSFDIIIINLLNNSMMNGFPNKKHKTIVLAGDNETYLLPYIQSFHGIVKGEKINEIRTAINVVINGGCYLSQEIKEQLFLKINENDNNRIDFSTEVLSDMELRVAEELISDKTNKEIADSLYLSKRTVEYHITSCIQKLNVNSRVGLAVKIAKANSLIGYSQLSHLHQVK